MFEFGEYFLDPDIRELKRGSKSIAIEPQVFDLLLFLVENRGRLVSKDEIVETVWSGRAISESTLSSRITAARKSIGDTGAEQRLIRTIPRKGFRFVGEVREDPCVHHIENQLDSPSTAQVVTDNELLSNEQQQEASHERKPASVLICDLIASHSPVDPEDWHAIITDCHARIKDISDAFGGTVAAPMSERLRVYFGLPHAHEDDGERAVRAGLAMLTAIQTLKPGGSKLHARPRIAIATSDIIVASKNNADGRWCGEEIIGEATSVAARIQDTASPERIFIDDATYRLLGSLFNCHLLNFGKTKEANQNWEIWEVLGESSVKNRFNALRFTSSRFTGRSEDLDFLLRRWDSAKRGQGQAVLVVGEPGIGKSRLCREFLERLPDNNYRCINFNCFGPYSNSVLYPVMTQLSSEAGLKPDDADNIKIQKLETVLKRSIEDVDAALLAPLIQTKFDQNLTSQPASPSHFREETQKLLLKYLKAECAVAPTIIVFEDLHWIDPTSLDLLSRVIDESTNWPLLILATARPEFTPPWPHHSHTRNMSLSRLGKQDSLKLLKSIDAGKSLSHDIRKSVLDRSDGVPLFIEELAIANLGSSPEASKIQQAKSGKGTSLVPGSVQASLLSRIDRLKFGKVIARLASVIGPEFTYELVKEASELSETDLDMALSELTDSQVIFQRGQPPEAFYKFKHVLLRDAAYATLPRGQKKDMHANILKVLENGSKTAHEVLAQHAALSGQTDKAISLWKSAAKQSSNRGAYREAANHLESAIALAKQSGGKEAQEQILELQGWLAFTWIAAEGYLSKNARQAAQRGVKLASRFPASPYRFLPNYAQWTLSLATGPQEQALAHIESLLSETTQADADFHQFFANAFAGYSCIVVGQLDQAQLRLETADRIYDHEIHNRGANRFGHIPGPDLYFRRALLSALQGSPDSAKAYMQKAVTSCPKSVDIHAEAQLLMKLGMVALFTRDIPSLKKYNKRLGEIANDYPGLSVAHIMSQLYQGMLLVMQGNQKGAKLFAQASKDYEKEIMIFESAPRWVAQADLLLSADLIDDAKEAYEQASVLINDTQEYMSKAELHRIAGILAMKDGDTSQARKKFKQAIKLAKQQGARLWELRATTELASISDTQSDLTARRAMLAKTVDKFSEGRDSADVQRALSVLETLGAQ